MIDLLLAASTLFDEFKTDTGRGRGNSGASPDNTPSSSSARRTGYNPSQTRGRDGRWVETNAESKPKDSGSDDGWGDLDAVVEIARKRQQEELKESKPTEVKREPPKDVDIEDLGRGGAQYKHETKDKNTLEVIILPVGDGKSKNVDFTVNDSMDKAESLDTAEANRISIKIAKIMQFEASQQKDGQKYETSAYTSDSDEYAAVRTYAYEKIAGFSRPVGGEPGASQYAIVKNGKLIPDMKRVKEEEDEEELPSVYIQQNVADYTKMAEDYRKRNKQNR